MFNMFKLFGMGFFWGGFESFVILFDCDVYCIVINWVLGGLMLCLYIGFESVDDFKDDFDCGFVVLKVVV